MNLTDTQMKRLRALVDGGGSGIVDRYGRVLIAGELQPHSSWPAWLNLVAKGMVTGENGRLIATDIGHAVISERFG